MAGYVCGTLLWVCCVLACGAVAAALADVVATLFPQSLTAPIRGAVIIGVIGGIALVNIGGVARGARLVSATTTLKLAPLAIFILASASAIHGSNFVQTVQPDAQGFGRALILAVFALVGTALSMFGWLGSDILGSPRQLFTFARDGLLPAWRCSLA